MSRSIPVPLTSRVCFMYVQVWSIPAIGCKNAILLCPDADSDVDEHGDTSSGSTLWTVRSLWVRLALGHEIRIWVACCFGC
jgi:hypothetical protein